MNFRELLAYLEDHLGNYQLPLNPRATSLRDLFDGIGLHHPLIKKVVHAIYEQNGCRRLTDPVNRTATLNALGPIRLEMLRAHSTDVDLYRLLDDLCAAAATAFDPSGDMPAGESPAPGKTRAQVIPLEPFRRRRRLKASRI
jgi:hypothetical protein